MLKVLKRMDSGISFLALVEMRQKSEGRAKSRDSFGPFIFAYKSYHVTVIL